jgi:hypothetical protein
MNDAVEGLDGAPVRPFRHRAGARLTALLLLVTTARSGHRDQHVTGERR